MFGKVGRSLLRALSQRQYSKFSDCKLNPGLKQSLKGWLVLLHGFGKPRKIMCEIRNEVDVVIFTDGWSPDTRKGEDPNQLPRTGFVIYDKRRSAPICGMRDVSKYEQRRWLPRVNPISMVEIVAVTHALAAVGHALRDSQVLIFVDSAAAEGALVKRGSSKDDICGLTLVFWRLVFILTGCPQILTYLMGCPEVPASWRGDSGGGRLAFQILLSGRQAGLGLGKIQPVR